MNQLKPKKKVALKPPIRYQVFGSMRFNSKGPTSEARILKEELADRGVLLHIIDVNVGQNITLKVFETMKKCDAFLAFGTED